MWRIVRNLLFIATLFSLSSCKEEETENKDVLYVFSKYLITDYLNPDTMVAEMADVDYQRADKKYKSVEVSFGGGEQYIRRRVLEREVEKFDSLSILYGDTCYNDKIMGGQHGTLAFPIERISVISDSDFDAQHPTGTSLNDIVSVYTYSYYKFVKSGYKGDRFIAINKKASEVTKEDLTLLCNYGEMEIYFPTPPTLSKHHTFTFTITFENGKVLTAKQEVEF